MGADLAVSAVFLANGAWFALGAVAFALRSRAAVRLVLSGRAGAAPPADVIAGVIRFLGGLNAALAVLCLGVVLVTPRRLGSAAVLLVCLAVAVAHLSQAAVNLPVALAERRGRAALWPVRGTRTGAVLGVDAVLAAATVLLAVLVLADPGG